MYKKKAGKSEERGEQQEIKRQDVWRLCLCCMTIWSKVRMCRKKINQM